MSSYKTQSIRSVALVGHGAAGKTSLIEALLFQAEAIPSKGSVERGTTVCDFEAQEKEAGHSLTSAIVNFGYENTHIHLIDTPGRRLRRWRGLIPRWLWSTRKPVLN